MTPSTLLCAVADDARTGDVLATAARLADRGGFRPLLVVGSRGHGALRAALERSRSLELARSARRPVVVVPPRWRPVSER